MKIIFTTNIDAYNEKQPFPKSFTAIPRKGDKIQVIPVFESYYRNLKLPQRLEVVEVTWKELPSSNHMQEFETIVVCELWYNSNDLKIAEVLGAKPL